MPKDYLVCTLPCLGYFDTSYYCAVLSDQLSQYKPIPRPNFAPESSYKLSPSNWNALCWVGVGLVTMVSGYFGVIAVTMVF